MSDKRVLSKKVTDMDSFINMPASTQALYLHLFMASDDDGFCDQVSISLFKAHASADDYNTLKQKQFILEFNNGVIVIKHWRVCNTIPKDRYHETIYKEDKAQLEVKDGIYREKKTEPVITQEIDNSKAEKVENAKEVINYLNSKTKKRYRANNEANQKEIIARLNEGYTVADCKKVIENKWADWQGTDYEKYVRPETLFRKSKFDGYLNEEISRRKSGRIVMPMPDYMYGPNEESKKLSPEEAEKFRKKIAEMRGKPEQESVQKDEVDYGDMPF